VQELEFYLDGERVAEPGERLVGKTFRMERRSKVKAFDMHRTVELRDDRLWETVRVSCGEATPLKLVYHFMHAWNPSATEYLAGEDSGDEVTGTFEADLDAERSFVVNEEVDWVAVYDGPLKKFSVARLVERPGAGGAMSKIWDVPGTYRKHYLQCFTNETVPKGFKGTWRTVTAFGEAGAGEWKAKARKLAGELKPH